MTMYEKLEWLHCQIQELQQGNELTNTDYSHMLEIVEEIREPYLIAKGETKPKLDDLLKSNLSLEEIDEIIAYESWGDLSK